MFRVWSVTRLELATVLLCLSFGGTLLADVPITSGSFNAFVQTGSSGPSGSISIQGPNFQLTCDSLFDGGFGMNGSLNSVVFDPNTVITGPCFNGGLIYNGIHYSNVGLNLTFTGRAATVPNSSLLGPVPGSASGQVTNIVFSMSGTVTTFSDAVGGTISNVIPVAGSGIFSASGIAGYANLQGSVGGSTDRFMPLPAFAQDTSSQGTWSPDYGGDGFYMANGMSQSSTDAFVSMPGVSAYTWASSTSDARALNNGADVSSRIASAYVGSYGADFDIRLALTGGIQRVALYLLDWDAGGRVEQITITDAATNAVIDSETFSNFQNGQYAVWTLSGNVNIHVARVSGASAVVSGIFFGPSGSSPSSPPPAPVISNLQTSSVTSTSATISWTTDEDGVQQVNYGVSSLYGAMATNGFDPGTNHSITLSGLNPNTTYYFEVVSTNLAGIAATSIGYSFTTAPPNSVAPNLGYVAFWGVSNSGVTISWSTDIPSDTQVAYGTSSALGQLSPPQPQLVFGHGVVLSGLASGTTYYFVARSTGADGSIGYSQVYTFTTAGLP